MMTRCVVLWALLSVSAQAQEWSGVSLDALPSVGVEHLTKHVDRELWRGALAEGALVRIEVLPSVEEAKRAFAFQSRALTSRVAEPGPKVADEAVGDGTDYLLIRDTTFFSRSRTRKVSTRQHMWSDCVRCWSARPWPRMSLLQVKISSRKGVVMFVWWSVGRWRAG